MVQTKNNDPQEIVELDVLNEGTIWERHGHSIWRANTFQGSPHFYPVYQYQDLYSYSPLALILHKGRIRVNPVTMRTTESTDLLYCDQGSFIDREIVRLGAPLAFQRIIRSSEALATAVARAMCEDIRATEERHPGYTNLVLCGGKDSQNLLLVPWKNPTVVASASPNYSLVREFMRVNGLNYPVVELEDRPQQSYDAEVLSNCCRTNLEHCRWGEHLIRLTVELNRKVIIWKGQCADAWFSPKWEKYSASSELFPNWLRSLWKSVGSPFKWKFRRLGFATGVSQRRLYTRHWVRAAMWQGSHVGFLRELTGVLVLSGYHGPEMRQVMEQVNLPTCVQRDIRPMIGERLLERPVYYPKGNPSPPISKHRAGLSCTDRLLSLLSKRGIIIDCS